ncbi:MAG: hypothetical protein FWC62_09730 [Firmicutes bacterium]|nr:hypothetical protein [Bacillota bacterium]
MRIKYGITFHPKWWNKNAGIDFSQPFFDDPAYRMDCDVRMRGCLYEHFGDLGVGEKAPEPRPLLGTDLLAAGYLYSELLGCKIVYEPDDSPKVVSPGLQADEISKIKAPDLDESPVWARTQRQIDWLLSKCGRVETYVNLMGIQNVAMDLMGQNLFTAYYTDEEEVRGLLEEIYLLTRDAGRRFRALSPDNAGGVTAIVRDVMPACYINSNCSVEMISNALYEKFLLEYDQKLSDDFGCFGVHHCGASMEHVVEGYSKIRGLCFAEAGAGSDLAAVRRALGGIRINARYSPVALISESEDTIAANVKRLYDGGKAPAGRGLLSLSCVGIDDQAPDGNIRAFLKACREL